MCGLVASGRVAVPQMSSPRTLGFFSSNDSQCLPSMSHVCRTWATCLGVAVFHFELREVWEMSPCSPHRRENRGRRGGRTLPASTRGRLDSAADGLGAELTGKL